MNSLPNVAVAKSELSEYRIQSKKQQKTEMQYLDQPHFLEFLFVSLVD